MNYFVIQVKTRGEGKFLTIARKKGIGEGVKLVWPRRLLSIRRKGRMHKSLAPIYPGYIFIEAEHLPNEDYWKLKRTPGFYRFLESNHNIKPLEGEDKRLLLHFLSFGEIVEKSLVTFDENSRIKVIDGPLSGLAGKIVKVDKRKKRAKVKLDLYDNSFLVDLSYEILEESKEKEKTTPSPQTENGW